MRKTFLSIIVLAVVCFHSSPALALSPMGPPTSGLYKGQLRAGVDYSYFNMDVDLNQGTSPGGGPSLCMNDLIGQYVLANVGYGLWENLEFSFRAGGGSAKVKEPGGFSFETALPELGNGYVIGFGTKATFIEKPDIEWGGLFQLLWAEAEGRARAGGTPWSASIGMWEIQIAAGPNYKLNEKMSIYGGPFLHIIDGKFKAYRMAGAGAIRYDLDEGSIFGGYIGSKIKLTSNADFCIEYQHTATADSIGMNLSFKLN